MEFDQIMSAVFLIAVLALILPGFLSTNSKLKQFIKNSFSESVNKIIVVTGKGLHSHNEKDPYIPQWFFLFLF